MSTPSTQPTPSQAALHTLLGSAIAMVALSIYQWFELLDVRKGGVPTCAINATFNCVTVWNSDFAKRLHDLFGLPVAGLGLVWGLGALALVAWLRTDLRKGDWKASEGAVKAWAMVGALSTITFVTASLRLGAFCLTCMGTYAIVAVFAGAALVMLKGPLFPQGAALTGAGARSMAVGAASYLLLLYPGLHTPKSTSESLGAQAPEAAAGEAMDFTGFFETLAPQDGEFAAVARRTWRESMTPDISVHPVRQLLGSKDAKLRVVDFTDVQCGHCKQFEGLLNELTRVTPPGSFSVETRHFPLDGECNAKVQRKSGNGISCLGARVQVCLENTPAFKPVREAIFEAQGHLSTDVIWSIATAKSGQSRERLEACVNDPATQAKIDDDVEYAVKFELDGTPLVLLNGRKTDPSPPFILGMALSGGDPNSKWFSRLPPPPAPEPHDHGH